jgi:hypothetical protein
LRLAGQLIDAAGGRGDDGNQIMGRTNYVASAGDWRPRPDRTKPSRTVDAHGLFYYKSQESLANVYDGTSNTIMFAECAGGITDQGDPLLGQKWTMNAWAWGIWFSAYGMCPNTESVLQPVQNVSTIDIPRPTVRRPRTTVMALRASRDWRCGQQRRQASRKLSPPRHPPASRRHRPARQHRCGGATHFDP